ncbi:MAG: pyridoxamine 5'-phosphate oxidase [Chitinophagales bacterium]|nr:pyridoxamine 5'-phosphate oxidase [Chitinophagales bacterium]MDW8273775.1 pyridoxamine 5'-phosphate oxidase [Chitinophagales bacterium]
MKLHELRKDYRKYHLSEKEVYENPFEQFKIWLDEAIKAKIYEPNAMTLATADKEGKPSARIVLLKEINEKGFIFYTNYNSRKGQEIDENPHVALLFYWDILERQVRIEGKIEKISEHQSREYFDSRPYENRIAAIISPQSQIVESRKYLEDLFEQKKAEGNIEKPSFWGGYVVNAEYFEFWQGRSNRIHDRIAYYLTDDGWAIRRLAP